METLEALNLPEKFIKEMAPFQHYAKHNCETSSGLRFPEGLAFSTEGRYTSAFLSAGMCRIQKGSRVCLAMRATCSAPNLGPLVSWSSTVWQELCLEPREGARISGSLPQLHVWVTWFPEHVLAPGNQALKCLVFFMHTSMENHSLRFERARLRRSGWACALTWRGATEGLVLESALRTCVV